MSFIVAILIILVGVLVGAVVLGVLTHKKRLSESFEKAQEESKKILDKARSDSDQMVKIAIKEAKEESHRRRKVFEEETKKRKVESNKLEKKLKQREQAVDSKYASLEARERKIGEKEKWLLQEEKKSLKLSADYEIAMERHQKALEKIASMSAMEAKQELIAALEEDAKKQAQVSIKRIEAETRKEAVKRARDIISLSIQRLAGEFVNDSTITVVNLPSEEMKGRIIGREGRNIRAIEQATGVDLIIDDTPEAVIISCFNPIRKEIAKITLDRLIADGRIHPSRIEETVKRVEEEFVSIVKDHGEQASFDAGITDLHPELVVHLGRLRFRNTGTQSVLQHAIETAQICGMMAAELGLNIKKAKRAGLLHDIGKALNHEIEGAHGEIGADLCAKYGESKDVVEAIRMHHGEDLLYAPALAVILGAANTLSENRPGARKELIQSYIKRLEDMENIAKSFPTVEKAYVLQAGREVRAVVVSDAVSDDDVRDLSDEIAVKLRQELTFPGQVRITVSRESRFMELAT